MADSTDRKKPIEPNIHIIEEDSRDHVIRWTSEGPKCSCKDCEYNHD